MWKSFTKGRKWQIGGLLWEDVGGKCACVLSWCIIFSTWTHGKVFTKPSAKIAWLNWADIQLLRKWMLLKGASQCCTPVSVKGPSLPLTLFLLLHLFMLLHLKLISHILWSDATDVALDAWKKRKYSAFFFLIRCSLFWVYKALHCKFWLQTSDAFVPLSFDIKYETKTAWWMTQGGSTRHDAWWMLAERWTRERSLVHFITVGARQWAGGYDCFSVTDSWPAARHFSQKKWMQLEKCVQSLWWVSENVAAGQGLTFGEKLCHLGLSAASLSRWHLERSLQGQTRDHKSTRWLGTLCPFGPNFAVLLEPCPRYRSKNDIIGKSVKI